MRKKILNLRVTLASDNKTPINVVINHIEPIAEGDEYFAMLQASCKAHNVDYIALLELMLTQSHYELFEEVDEAPINDDYNDYAYDKYKMISLWGYYNEPIHKQ